MKNNDFYCKEKDMKRNNTFLFASKRRVRKSEKIFWGLCYLIEHFLNENNS